ncbi:hypothetical protein ACLQ2R_22235 [Streptosporangium sp. DT93]|uniref:hypothetical protein n=1 Tax=Streptosporangium sp. DT93 TaxID=3393428 RepID=UPI003CF56EF9
MPERTGAGRGAGERSRTAGTGRSRAGSPGNGSPGNGTAGGGARARTSRSPFPQAPGGGRPAAGISAAYACRHLPPGDWRHAYCVRVWNDYKHRNGLP